MEEYEKSSGLTARMVTQFALVIAIFIIGFFGSGCASNDVTNPPRSATEQLLISTAMDHAMTNADLSYFANKKVFLDASYFDSYDEKYAFGEIRDALSSAGALLVDKVADCDLVVEARAGALSIDYNSSLFGIPSMGIPVPLSGSLSIPELPFFKSEDQRAYGKIALLAYDYKTRKHYYSTGPMIGKSYNYYHEIFLFSWNSTDIPAKHKPRKHGSDNSDEFPSATPSTPPASTSGSSAPSSNLNGPPTAVPGQS